MDSLILWTYAFWGTIFATGAFIWSLADTMGVTKVRPGQLTESTVRAHFSCMEGIDIFLAVLISTFVFMVWPLFLLVLLVRFLILKVLRGLIVKLTTAFVNSGKFT